MHGEHLNTFLSAEGRGGARRDTENTLTPFYPQIMVVEQEYQARNGPMLPADVLHMSHFEWS